MALTQLIKLVAIISIPFAGYVAYQNKLLKDILFSFHNNQQLCNVLATSTYDIQASQLGNMSSLSCFLIKYYFNDIVLNFNKYTELVSEFRKNSKGILNDIIQNGHINLKAIDNATLASLLKIGIFNKDGLYLSFSYPVAEQFYRKEYIKTFVYSNFIPVSSPQIDQQEITQFIHKVLIKIDRSLLRFTYSINVDRTYIERIYQNEFYYSVWPARLSCNIGIYFGMKGAVNFYLNSKFQWAFELLRDGKRLKEHFERFQKYGKIKMRDWAVIDFCVKETNTVQNEFSQDKYHYCLIIGSNSQQATLYHNYTTTIFNLMQSR
ncbi:2187_t:CDS:2 [Funneliformis caledonium]|uniref:2187_t:CDS:1 n=1 Tax=Funneliformis caledonium TaxID=1117310 RepID=A0A9N9HQV9_9GLOM|nr:2187_t:CDS:2 [Funneliformis caledonium]